MTQQEIDTLKCREAALMQDWHERWHTMHANQPWFNEDGIVDYERWRAIPDGKHLLVLLKETNGLQTSLVDFLRSGGSRTYWRTWNNVARWANLVLNGTYWEFVPKPALDDMIRNIAVVNLKKYAGGPLASRKQVLTEASKDVDLLRRQIGLYQPDIILTGGWQLVSDFLHDEIDPEPTGWIQPNVQTKLWYYEAAKICIDHTTLVVCMPHPNRAAKQWTLELEKVLRTVGRM